MPLRLDRSMTLLPNYCLALRGQEKEERGYEYKYSIFDSSPFLSRARLADRRRNRLKSSEFDSGKEIVATALLNQIQVTSSAVLVESNSHSLAKETTSISS